MSKKIDLLPSQVNVSTWTATLFCRVYLETALGALDHACRPSAASNLSLLVYD